MQQVGSMTFGEGIIGAAASGLVGWLTASVTKVGKREFEKLIARVDTIEKDVNSRMTRTDFDKEFGEVKMLVRDFRLETRDALKELKNELKTKT